MKKINQLKIPTLVSFYSFPKFLFRFCFHFTFHICSYALWQNCHGVSSSFILLYICDDIKENMKEQRISVTRKMRRTQLGIFLSVKVSDSFCSSFFFSMNSFFLANLQVNVLTENVVEVS